MLSKYLGRKLLAIAAHEPAPDRREWSYRVSERPTVEIGRFPFPDEDHVEPARRIKRQAPTFELPGLLMHHGSCRETTAEILGERQMCDDEPVMTVARCQRCRCEQLLSQAACWLASSQLDAAIAERLRDENGLPPSKPTGPTLSNWQESLVAIDMELSGSDRQTAVAQVQRMPPTPFAVCVDNPVFPLSCGEELVFFAGNVVVPKSLRQRERRGMFDELKAMVAQAMSEQKGKARYVRQI